MEHGKIKVQRKKIQENRVFYIAILVYEIVQF